MEIRNLFQPARHTLAVWHHFIERIAIGELVDTL